MQLTARVVRVPIVVLTLLVALGTALGLAAAPARAASDDQQWGFVDTPTAVDAGWQGPLTVSWRTFPESGHVFRVTLTGPGLAWEGQVVPTAEETSFRRELAVPALETAGTYLAELRLEGSDEVLADARVVVGGAEAATAPRIVDVRASSRAISPAGTPARQGTARRSVTSFGVDTQGAAAARVGGRILDQAGRTVVARSFGTHVTGDRMQWAWAGQDTTGAAVRAGHYTLQLTARADGRTTTRTVALRVVR